MTNDRKARAARAEAMRKEREKADRKQRNMISVAIVAVVVVIIGIAAWGISSISASNEKNTEVIEPRNLVEGAVPFEPTGDVEVAENAPVVEVFEDFLCPACAQFDAYMSPTLYEFAESGEIQFRFQPFSFMHTASTNEYSRRAMNIAMCAVDEQGPAAFWDVKTALFLNQPTGGGAGPSNDDLLETAQSVGVEGLDECVRTEKFVPWIDQARTTSAEDRGVTGTPTLHINGEESEARTPEDFSAAIAAATN